MGNHFFVQFQKCVVKYGVDLLGLGNFKLAVDTVHNKNFEWPMLFWGQLGFQVCRCDVGSFQLY